MKTSELRRANLVQDSFGIMHYVCRIWQNGAELSEDMDGSNDIDYEISEIYGIPLTEEWLLRLGFEKFQDRLTIEAWAPGHPSQRFTIDILNNNVILKSRYQAESDDLLMNHIKHIHQLQNLYFALTGEELKLIDE